VPYETDMIIINAGTCAYVNFYLNQEWMWHGGQPACLLLWSLGLSLADASRLAKEPIEID